MPVKLLLPAFMWLKRSNGSICRGSAARNLLCAFKSWRDVAIIDITYDVMWLALFTLAGLLVASLRFKKNLD